MKEGANYSGGRWEEEEQPVDILVVPTDYKEKKKTHVGEGEVFVSII